METLDYIYSGRMTFLLEEHLLKAIQQKHPSLSFLKPLFKRIVASLPPFIQLLSTHLLIASCMYKKFHWV